MTATAKPATSALRPCYWCARKTRRTVQLPNCVFRIHACRRCYHDH